MLYGDTLLGRNNWFGTLQILDGILVISYNQVGQNGLQIQELIMDVPPHNKVHQKSFQGDVSLLFTH